MMALLYMMRGKGSKGSEGKVLKIDRPDGRKVLRFDGAFGPEGCGGGFAADYKKADPRPPSFRPKRSGVEKSHAPNDRKASPRPPVISTVAERSGEISRLMVRAALRWEIFRLRVSSKHFPSAPYQHATPLEMTVLASSIQSFQKGTNPIPVISTAAKRSGEISPSDGTGGIEAGDLQAQKGRFLRLTGPMGRRVLKFDGPLARGLWIAALRQ